MRLVEKPKDFRSTLKQLIVYIRPYYGKIILSLLLMITSTIMCIYGPKLIGNVTTILSEGIISKYQGGAGIDFVLIRRLVMIILAIYGVSALIDYFVAFVHTAIPTAVTVIYSGRLLKEVN